MRVFIPFLLVVSCFGADSAVSIQPRSMAFEARDRQYVSHGAGYSLVVAPHEAVLNLEGHVLRMSVARGNANAALEALHRMPGKANYILGRDIRASYDLYGRVRWREIYPGIDLVFHGNQEHLEYDFNIAAGRDPRKIEIKFDGAEEIRIDSTGALILRVGGIEVRQPAPVAYEAETRKPVTVAYQLDRTNRVRFRVGNHDRAQALVIDPQIVFDNSFGGNALTTATGIALDAQGNIYVTGQTSSADFPLQNAAQNHPGAAPLLSSSDAGNKFTAPPLGPVSSVRSIAAAPTAPSTLYAATNTGVIKSIDGGTTWTTPANVGLTALPVAVAVDVGSANTVYAAASNAGVFTSTDGGASWSLSTNGLIVPGTVPLSSAQYLSLVPNPKIAGTVFAVASFPSGVYRSTDFGQTWKLLKLPSPSSPESLVFSTTDSNTLYVGQQSGPFLISTDGGDTWQSEASRQPVTAAQGLAILPGNPPTLIAAGDTAVSRSTDGGFTWTPVLPTVRASVAADPNNPTAAYALDVSGLYRSVDAGLTWTKAALPYQSSSFVLFVSPADSRILIGQSSQPDAFVTKWSADGSTILYSTYIGGSGTESATGIAVDSSGSAYITGTTSSPDFPVSKNAFQKTVAPTRSAFVAKLSADGSQLAYSTLIGAVDSSGRIAVNKAGEAFVAGETHSQSFPVTPGSIPVPQAPICLFNSPFVQTSGFAYASKISADGSSLVFSDVFGGTCGTQAQAVAFDAGGNAWVGGNTDSPNFQVTKDAMQPVLAGGTYDGFLTEFSPSGGLTYSTYIGGAGFDIISGITFDSKGNLYLTGTSGGLSQPATPGAVVEKVTVSCVIFSFGPGVYQATGSGFVLKLDPTAHTTLGLTYLGSPLCLYPSDIAVDSAGAPWIAGPLSSFGSAPQTASPFQIGIGNGFITKFSTDFKELLFSTYFDSVSGIAIDSSGLAYVAGSRTEVFPAQTGQAYVAKIDPAPPPVSLDAIQNAINPASPSNFQGITGGELLRILGKNMGPATTTPGIINNGVLATTVANVQVTFDGVAVPLLSVSGNEIDLVAPFSLATKTTTTVRVLNRGVSSNAVNVAVALPINYIGVQSGIPIQVLDVFNEDFTLNSKSNPAKPGSAMILYVSGVGNSVPPSVDGQVNMFPYPAPPAPLSLQAPSNTSQPNFLPIIFAGGAPGLAAGIFQINFVAPQQSAFVSFVIGPGNTVIQMFVQ